MRGSSQHIHAIVNYPLLLLHAWRGSTLAHVRGEGSEAAWIKGISHWNDDVRTYPNKKSRLSGCDQQMAAFVFEAVISLLASELWFGMSFFVCRSVVEV